MQVSTRVNGLPSSQPPSVLLCRQPLAAVQLSSVHALPSSHFTALPMHTPLELHASPVVHALPSLHADATGVCVQPATGLQPSNVHALPSSQAVTALGVQTPPPHTSPTVQSLPSLQAPVLAVPTQPLSAWQASSVHTLPSLQILALGWCTQVPIDAQLSVVQFQPSLHPVLQASLLQSAGQVATDSPTVGQALHTPSPQKPQSSEHDNQSSPFSHRQLPHVLPQSAGQVLGPPSSGSHVPLPQTWNWQSAGQVAGDSPLLHS